jgi:membrane fusion protein (multidrug efflux system)
MKKRIIFVILGLVVVIAILAAVKGLQIGAMIKQGKSLVPPPETVTSAVVKADSWTSDLTAVGSLTAVQGVTVAADLAGKIVKINFESGARVNKGDLLVRLDTSSEEAQLPGAVAQAKQARADLERSEKMVTDGIISQSDYDKAVSTFDQAQAQANNIRATINKKMICAPFSGRLGIRQVNLGQMLREGDPIVTLQALSPIFVDFSLPQQQLAQLRTGQPVRVNCDAVTGQAVEGKITAINPLVDSDTRNIKIQATVANRIEKLRPGMFVTVAVGLPVRQTTLVIPATAVLYASYSDSVFVIEKDKDGKSYKLRQQFVRLGEKRGDFVAVTSGLKEGETVVSTGVFKLRNGQTALIDNKLSPAFKQSPKPENN